MALLPCGITVMTNVGKMFDQLEKDKGFAQDLSALCTLVAQILIPGESAFSDKDAYCSCFVTRMYVVRKIKSGLVMSSHLQAYKCSSNQTIRSGQDSRCSACQIRDDRSRYEGSQHCCQRVCQVQGVPRRRLCQGPGFAPDIQELFVGRGA